MGRGLRTSQRPAGRTRRGWLVAAAILLLAGCASRPPVALAPVPLADWQAACDWLDAEVDRRLSAVGAGDAAAARIAGFPGLRVDRLLASFSAEALDPPQLSAWLLALAALDAAARRHELAVLEGPVRRRLEREWVALAPDPGLRVQPEPALADCRARRVAWLLEDPQAAAQLRAAATVPDAYRDWQRAAGLYPLVAPLVRPRVLALHARLAAPFGAEAAPGVAVQRYAVPLPPDADAAPPPAALAADALGMPRPDDTARARLLAAHAPAWVIASAGEPDRPGAVVLDGRDQPFVATWHPVEYRALGWTRLGERVLLQLRYTLWFAERPRTGPLDIYAGQLDAVTWRVTLDEQGGVVAYDSMHGCGCYYLLLPGPGWRVAPVGPREEPVFSPAHAPELAAGERIELHLSAGTHYLRDVRAVPAMLPARELIALEEDGLRSLPRAAGGRRSAYTPDGLIPVSRRPERFLLWPLGVPSAGALRQPGTHAIAFIGRRHFDDARLLETLLEIAP
jgi:hypothetical protein